MRYCTKDGSVRLLERGQEGLFEAIDPGTTALNPVTLPSEAFANIYADFAEVLWSGRCSIFI